MGSYYDAVGLLALCDAIDNVEGIPFKPISPPRTLLLNGSGNLPFTGPLPSPYPPLRVTGFAPAQAPKHPYLTHVPPAATVSATGSLPYAQSQRLGYQQFVAQGAGQPGNPAMPAAGGPGGPGQHSSQPHGSGSSQTHGHGPGPTPTQTQGPGGPGQGPSDQVLVPSLPPPPGSVNLTVVPRPDAPHMHQPVGAPAMPSMGMPPAPPPKMSAPGPGRAAPYPPRQQHSSEPSAGENSHAGAIVDGFRIEECHVCGRIFKGPKAATHKQQHIRRLHPHMYMPKRGGKRRIL